MTTFRITNTAKWTKFLHHFITVRNFLIIPFYRQLTTPIHPWYPWQQDNVPPHSCSGLYDELCPHTVPSSRVSNTSQQTPLQWQQ